MKFDEYKTVLNSEETFKEIADYVKNGHSVVIAWTDEEGTQFDILFVYNPLGFGNLQGGVRQTDLFVSIMRVGAFGFDAFNLDTDWGYYDEKLSGRNIGMTTSSKLAELINGVKRYIVYKI